MKFTFSVLVYILIGLVLGWAILALLKGSYWPLIVSLLAYVVAFARIGCADH
ncbi:MAG: hypothetical protein U1G07_19550 [Verrucomicrobiota bacterium]